jgi:flagellar biosynthesis GTPase FlhF
MTAEEAAEWGKTLSFEKVWAVITENDRQMVEARVETERKMAETEKKIAETRAESEKIIAEARAESERKMAEAHAETEKKMAEAHAETEKKIAETRAETEKKMAEYRAETERKYTEAHAESKKIITEAHAEYERQHAKTERAIDKMAARIDRMAARVDRVTVNVGGLNRSMGELIETLIAARLWEKFPRYGLNRAYQRVPLYDEKSEVKTDIDILLVNTALCMAVEVKHELNHKDEVDRHVKRMGLIRKYPPELVNGKQLLGAMAGGVVDPDVKDYAYKSGFYVLELTGESVHLIRPPEGFKPQEW